MRQVALAAITYVRGVIALAADLPDEAMPGLDLAWEYHTGPAELDAAAASLRSDRAALDRAAELLVERTAAAALTLVRERALSVQDAAELLDVSPQRVAQLAPGGSERKGS